MFGVVLRSDARLNKSVSGPSDNVHNVIVSS